MASDKRENDLISTSRFNLKKTIPRNARYSSFRFKCYSGRGLTRDEPTAMTDSEAKLDRQMRKGLLGLAALSALAGSPQHGYALAQSLHAVFGASIPEGTLYPLLSGFEAEGWVGTEWDTSRPGPARKVYKITESGREALQRLGTRFAHLADAIQEGF
jgi:PadR family transcriptional regulator PadR